MPSELPRFAKTTTRRIFVTGFDQKPLTVDVALGRSSKSVTLGLRIQACIIPATQPAARKGFKLVKGAAIKAETITRGCARAIAAPAAESRPLTKIHI